MKKQLSLLIPIAVITLIPLSSNSQEYPGCFMVNERGDLINLNDVCQGGSTSGDVPSSTTAGKFEVKIKRRQSNIPVVDVLFNNSIPFEMMFDTGASTIAISPQMAVALGVEEEGKQRVSTAGGDILAGRGRLKTVKLGDLVVKDLEVSISPHLSFGLLGQNFYAGYDVTIKEDTIEFSRR